MSIGLEGLQPTVHLRGQGMSHPRRLWRERSAERFAWNWFLHPLVYLGGNKNLWTLPLGLNALKGEQGGPPSTHYQMAFSVLMIVPMLIVFAVGQRSFVQGIVTTGIKG